MQTMTKLAAIAAIASISLLPTIAHADLAPAQEEAKTAFESETEDAITAMNGACGTKIAVTADFEHFDTDVWAGTIQPQALCKLVITTVEYMCKDRPAYKKVMGKQLSKIHCSMAGAKPAQKKDGLNDFTLRNMDMTKGVFTLRMHKDMVNVEDNSQKTLEKALNKK